MTTRAARYLSCCILVMAVMAGFLTPANAEETFPLRPYYPEVPFIGTDKLLDIYDSAIIVDIRSSFEYDVARVNKALLLPLTDTEFAEKLEKIRPKTDPTPMAFYCNGHSCAKSYQAAQLALSLGF
ncbi:rhodanese-like domain-containing protein, partial [Pseudodesulfovibrio sp.]|nr:rhodanese-like domain-containing protein [Pseudodesulfovibrio sp.]